MAGIEASILYMRVCSCPRTCVSVCVSVCVCVRVCMCVRYHWARAVIECICKSQQCIARHHSARYCTTLAFLCVSICNTQLLSNFMVLAGPHFLSVMIPPFQLLKLKGKVYATCVRSCLMHGSETWPMKVDDCWRWIALKWVWSDGWVELSWMRGRKMKNSENS